MNASNPLLAIALVILSASAHAQHGRLVENVQGPAASADPSTQTARHVEAEHLSEVTLYSEQAGTLAADAALLATVPPQEPHMAAVAAVAEPAPAVRPQGIGDATRSLLRLQASGQAAPALLPMLGAPSTAATKRYLDSFNHPIPEFFDTTVPTSNSSP